MDAELKRIDEETVMWQAALEVAVSEAEVYCCNDALGKLAMQRILAEAGLWA